MRCMISREEKGCLIRYPMKQFERRVHIKIDSCLTLIDRQLEGVADGGILLETISSAAISSHENEDRKEEL